MVLTKAQTPLQIEEVDEPEPSEGQVLVRVHACGICRTDLHIVDGELKKPKLPLIPGHQIVGVIEKLGKKVTKLIVGQRIGIPWLGGSCGKCSYCLSERENLCDQAIFTGYQINGGYAELCVADERFCFPLPDSYSDLEIAPLLCAGLIGYRCYRMTGDAQKLGFYGFGASAHILIQVACYHKKQVYAFTRKGDEKAQQLAKELGAVWVGNSEEAAPETLDSAIVFAPVGDLVPKALAEIAKGGSVVCAGIHMSDIPSFPYSILWGERILRSVANLTRKDGIEFLELAPKIPVKTKVTSYPLEKANEALSDLREGHLSGAAVLIIKGV